MSHTIEESKLNTDVGWECNIIKIGVRRLGLKVLKVQVATSEGDVETQ